MRASHAVGRITANERDAIIGGDLTWVGKQPRGIVFCHGAGDLAMDPYRDQNWLLRLMGEFATVHVGDLGGDQWGNETAMSRITAAIAYLRNTMGVKGKVGLVGMSMGGGTALAYARKFPNEVAAVAGVIPLISFADAIANRGLGAAINAAYPNPVTHRWVGTANDSNSEQVDADGAVVARNLAPNQLGVNIKGLVGSTANSQAGAIVLSANGGPIDNGPYARRTFTSTSSSGSKDGSITYGHPNWGGVNIGGVAPISDGTRARLSAYVRSNIAQVVQIQAQGLTGTGGAGSALGPSVALVANAWTRLDVDYTASGNAISVRLDIDTPSAAVAWQNGNTLDFANPMMTLGSTLLPWFGGASAGFNRGYLEDIDGPLRSPLRFAGSLPADLPIKLWPDVADTLTPSAVAQQFVTARPQTEINILPGWGHTDNAVTIATPEIVEWMRSKVA